MDAFKAFMFNLGGDLKHTQIEPNKEGKSLKIKFCMCIYEVTLYNKCKNGMLIKFEECPSR